MQLKKGVFLTLTPIISALVVALSLTIWTFIFDQTKNNEIERARLAIEVSMVDLRQWATELVTGLDKATEYENLLAHEISSENIQDRQSLGNGFVQFSYFLNARIPGIKEIMLLDSDLNLLTHASEGGLLHFRTDQPNLSQAVRDQLNSLYAYMRSRTLDNGIISYVNEGENELLAVKIFQPDQVPSPQVYMAAVTANGFTAKSIPNFSSIFKLRPSGPTSLADISGTPTLISEATSGNTTYLFSDSPLFYVSTEIESRAIISEMSGFSLTLIAISLLLIFSLLLVVILIVNRQILSPIAELEHKIGLSMSTGVINLKSSEERNEVEALGNRYLELMNKVARLANMDALTQLPNRDQFLTSVANTLKHQPENRFVLFYLDLDRFKQVNDFYGHAEGDRLLRTFARELQKAANNNLVDPKERTALISRLAGDEFVVFTELGMLKELPETAAEELVKNLSTDFDTGQGKLHLEVSVGVAMYPEHASSAESLLARADEAMFEAKNRGRNRWQVLNQNIVEQNELKKLTQEAIEEALQNDQFYLVYQPIFNTHTLKPIGAEVLLRSTHEALKKIGTQAYIEIAEASGAIRRIDSFVVNFALAQLARIRETHPNFHFSINFSAAELTTPDFAESLSHAVASAGLTSDAVEIEVTETRWAEFGRQALNNLENLHHAGFLVALDDFGTGYNSFAQLNSSHIARLKIDRRFVAAINTESRDANMVNIILGTAQLYKMDVVAEGIETEEQLAYIQAHNCQYIQGYLLAKPMEWENLCEFLNMDMITWESTTGKWRI
ncbi:MAG: putative bifunctional diguanylate cyclase/phosphodiesterase [Porticoccaceae bacterium]